MSDERKKAKSRKASDERRDEVAARLGMDPVEIAVFTNPDGEYAVVKDGSRLLLQEEGKVAWYGDKAPNPTYPLVRPTVELDESDLDEVEAPSGPSPSDGEPTEPLQPDNPDLAQQQPVGEKKPGPAPRTSTTKK